MPKIHVAWVVSIWDPCQGKQERLSVLVVKAKAKNWGAKELVSQELEFLAWGFLEWAYLDLDSPAWEAGCSQD